MHQVFRNVFSQEELEEIRFQFISKCKEESQDDDIFNRSKLTLLGTKFKGPYTNKIKDSILEANKTFNMTLFEDTPFEKWNLSTYTDGGFCTSHNDIIEGVDWQRKLTVIVEIFRDCEGGELEMSDQDFVTNKLPLNLQPGDAVVFPSFVNHSVTPITSGTRQSLTGWIKGPALT